MNDLIVFNKPYGVICQFTPHEKHGCLKDYIDVPGFYPAGRLDTDSEGLLLLTDNGRLQAQIADPKYKQEKTYWAQVEGSPDESKLAVLRQKMDLGDFVAQGARVRVLAPEETASLWQRQPPIRERKSVPDFWLEITIREGKNRQVRRMTAAVGFPTLRLIRTQIGSVNLIDLGVALGESTPLEALFYDEFRHLLKQKNKTQDHAKSGLSWKDQKMKDQQRKNQSSKDHSNNGFKPNKTKSKNSQTEKSDSRQKSGNPSSGRRNTNSPKPSNRRATTKQRNKE